MQWIKNVFQLFYPPLCCGCNEHLDDRSEILCASCLLSLNFFPKTKGETNEIKRRFYGKLAVNHCLSVLFFTEKSITQKMLHQLKYQKQQAVSEFIGLLAWQHLSDHSVFDWAQCIVPIPLHPSKEKLRGYNQLDGFGKYLSQKSGIPYYKDFLIKAAKSDTQTRKNIIERSENSKNFVINPSYSHLKQQRILLIDDVITTGATLEAAGNCILKNSNNEISVLTMSCVK